jgi:catechol 2,3-dioxygenase-like lactoylglutathione lyase family enzyme
VAYRSVTHVAIRVTGLREAERYYRTIFGLQVAFREAEVADGWTLPVGAEWEDAEAAGIPLSMCFLARDGFPTRPGGGPELRP